MIKTISFELSKRLTEYLDNIETEYWIWQVWWVCKKWELEYLNDWYNAEECGYKTLTISEALDFLPKRIWNYHLQLNLYWDICEIKYISAGYSLHSIEVETLLEAIENILEYLLDTNMLTK